MAVNTSVHMSPESTVEGRMIGGGLPTVTIRPDGRFGPEVVLFAGSALDTSPEVSGQILRDILVVIGELLAQLPAPVAPDPGPDDPIDEPTDEPAMPAPRPLDAGPAGAPAKWSPLSSGRYHECVMCGHAGPDHHSGKPCAECSALRVPGVCASWMTLDQYRIAKRTGRDPRITESEARVLDGNR